MAYSLPPLRKSVRLMVTSLYSIGRAPSALSIVSTTSARPSGPFVAVPAKMTSSILPPRRDFAPCSPITQARASTTLDLPEPLGPTTQVMPGSSCKVVAEANDLNPRSVRVLRYTVKLLTVAGMSQTRNHAVGKTARSSLPAAAAKPAHAHRAAPDAQKRSRLVSTNRDRLFRNSVQFATCLR